MTQLRRAMPSGSLLMLVLFIAVLLSAIGVAYSAHWNRQLLNELYGEGLCCFPRPVIDPMDNKLVMALT